MRTEREIIERATKLVDLSCCNVRDPEYYEAICCQIDALLWVIEDKSGDELLDKRRRPNVFCLRGDNYGRT